MTDNTFNAINAAFDTVFSYRLNSEIEDLTGFVINPVAGYNCEDEDVHYCNGRYEAMDEILKCFIPEYEEKLVIAAKIVAANLVAHFRSVINPEAGADEPLQLLPEFDRTVTLPAFVAYKAYLPEDTSHLRNIGAILK